MDPNNAVRVTATHLWFITSSACAGGDDCVEPTVLAQIIDEAAFLGLSSVFEGKIVACSNVEVTFTTPIVSYTRIGSNRGKSLSQHLFQKICFDLTAISMCPLPGNKLFKNFSTLFSLDFIL